MHVLFVILLVIVTSGCITSFPPPRVIRESGELLVRLEPANKCDVGAEGKSLSHPVRFTHDELRALLASLSAREKVGLLNSFLGTPGTPRLFSNPDLDLLVPAAQEAFAKATSEEAVVFLLARPTRESRIDVTSGTLGIHDGVLSIVVSNFRHPVRAARSEVGATDRLGDVKETLAYVQASPCVSVGEQDFAIFFDTPRFQLETRSGSLLRYPERALSITYHAFLAAQSDATKRLPAVENTLQQPSIGAAENQAIADLKRRIIELEQVNQALTARTRTTSSMGSAVEPFKPNSDNSPLSGSDSQATLMEIIKRLETRVSDLERHIREHPVR